jgi:peptidyl-dipeptidase Dcp
MTNPFINASDKKTFGTRDEAIDFSQIKTEHFMPAIDTGIDQARENIKKIKNNSQPATFENTLVALESASELMEQASGIYWNLFSAHGTPEHHALAKDISPKLAAFSSEVNLDPDLFKRVKNLFDQLATLKLTGEQEQMLDKYYKGFVRNGALLNEKDKETLRNIDQELSVLSPKFSENILKATNTFELWITDKKDLAGLPDGAIEAASMEASKKNKPGQWLFTLQAPSLTPFLQYADNRELRHKLWIAYGSTRL